MSIITEALKKAEKERNGKVLSKDYIDKILGPKIEIVPEPFKAFDAVKPEVKRIESGQKPKILLAVGSLILLFIVFLSAFNAFIFSSIEKADAPISALQTRQNTLEAEAYSTDMKSDVALIEKKTSLINAVTRTFKGITLKEAFLSNFKLNGIIYDTDNAWAVINNQMLKEGEAISGATLISIEPQKVVMRFENETFYLESK